MTSYRFHPFFYPTSFPPNQSHLSSLIPFNLVHFHPIPYIPMHSNLISSIQSHPFNLIHRRRTGAEFGGRKTISQTKISERRFFKASMSILTPKISDDLF